MAHLQLSISPEARLAMRLVSVLSGQVLARNSLAKEPGQHVLPVGRLTFSRRLATTALGCAAFEVRGVEKGETKGARALRHADTCRPQEAAPSSRMGGCKGENA